MIAEEAKLILMSPHGRQRDELDQAQWWLLVDIHDRLMRMGVHAISRQCAGCDLTDGTHRLDCKIHPWVPR